MDVIKIPFKFNPIVNNQINHQTIFGFAQVIVLFLSRVFSSGVWVDVNKKFGEFVILGLGKLNEL